jgi:hypothetical protein
VGVPPRWLLAVSSVVTIGAMALVPVTEDASNAARGGPGSPAMNPSSPAAPAAPLDLLFVHHSCGGQLLAPAGRADGEACIFRSHPNGGDLRAKLEASGYVVHEASYGSRIGEATDLFDWLPKFRDRMDDVLATRHQDERLPDGRTNRIVVFKSCFPNNAFVAEGEPPGDPRGPALTYWNARATLAALLPELARRPDVLFVYVTAPPLAPKRREAAYRWLARKLGALPSRAPLEESAALARRFDDWVTSPSGWLAGYAGTNVAVFDYYDVLTGGTSDVLAYPTGGGYDSHPSSEGNARAAALFVPFLDRAVQRARLVADAAGRAASAAK